MLLNSLILLLLSNSITPRRDKSILHSRAYITIFLVAAFIAYDNSSTLFLEKGVYILGGSFNITTTAIYFHIFVLLMGCGVFMLNSFHIFYRYQLPLFLFIFSPRNISIAIIMVKITLYLLDLYNSIPTHRDIVDAFSYTLAALQLEYGHIELDGLLVNKMDSGDSPYPTDNKESPYNHFRDGVRSEVAPYNPKGGFTPINSPYYLEKVYDAEGIRIRYLYYKNLSRGIAPKLDVFRIEDFNTKGEWCYTQYIGEQPF